jgi:acyl-CoA thioesterase I
VVFPEPEEPTIAKVSPELTSRFIGCNNASVLSANCTDLVSALTLKIISEFNCMKKYPLLVVIFFSFLSLVSRVWATDSILLLGDSISASYGMKQEQGWVHLLNQQLNQDDASYKIANASISGETTSGGLSRLGAILSTKKITHLIIELGGNDGLRGYAPKVIKNNLLQMIDLAQQKNIPVSLMQIKITPNYGPRYNKMFEQIFSQIAKEKKVTLLPFFMEKIALNPDLMQADGIHPNIAAQPLIVEFMRKQLNTLISPNSLGN